MLNKILVAIDITETNNNTFNTAFSLAQTTGAKLILLNIIAPNKNSYPNPFIYSGYEFDVMDESLLTVYQQQWQQFKQQGKELLHSLADEAIAAGVETEYIQDFGHPGRTICDRAESQSVDLILVGSRGLTGVKEIFLGSVSNYVTHHAPCSVLIVRGTNNSASDSELVEERQTDSTTND